MTRTYDPSHYIRKRRPRDFTPEDVTAWLADLQERDKWPTIAGLALWLEMRSRARLYDWLQTEGNLPENQELADKIESTITYIESLGEELAISGRGNNATLFWLKNLSHSAWADRHELQVKDPLRELSYSNLEERSRLLDAEIAAVEAQIEDMRTAKEQ